MFQTPRHLLLSTHMTMRRRSKKSTPLKELLFLLFVGAGFLLAKSQLGRSDSGLIVTGGIILFFALLAGAGLYLFSLWQQHTRQKALRAVDMAKVDEMTGLEFEKYVAALLNSRGYKTKLTPINDYGVDIIARKGKVKIAVQVKRYSNKLDQKPVREAIAGKSARQYGCTQAMVVTNSTFTKAAKFLAKEGDCALIDRGILGKWILEFQGANAGGPTV